MGKKLYKDLHQNQRIAHLVLLEEVYRCDKNRKRKYWKCKCKACGKIFIAREDSIKNGDQISCGCIGKAYRHLWLLRHKGVYNGNK